jgi:hypothetical protein
MLSLADAYIKRRDARYPVGRARLEALGVLGCAVVMSFAAVEVCQFSVADIYRGAVYGTLPDIHIGPSMYTALLCGIAAKGLLYMQCRAAQASQPQGGSDTLAALAEDHLNDVWSKCAAAAPSLACKRTRVHACTRALTHLPPPQLRRGHHGRAGQPLGRRLVGGPRRRHCHQRCHHSSLVWRHPRADQEDHRCESTPES